MATKETLRLYRGDTFDKDITVENYTPISTDVIKFGIRKNFDDTDYLVEKTIDSTSLHLHLEVSDTQNLPEECVYDIQITYEDEDGISYTQTFVYGKVLVIKDVVR